MRHCNAALPTTHQQLTESVIHVQDLKEAVATLKAKPKLAKSGNAPLYGMAAVVPDRSIVSEFLIAFQDIQFEL